MPAVQNAKKYKARLDARLKRLKIGRSELAHEANMDPSQITRWFATDIEPKLSSIEKVEAAISRIRTRRRNAKIKAEMRDLGL